MFSFSFPHLEGLLSLARRDGVDIRPTLLRVLTDLYVQKSMHSPDEERHYTELALRLLDAVDIPVRKAVATRLAHHPDAPLAVLGRLTRDVAEIAAIIRSNARGPSSIKPLAREVGAGTHAHQSYQGIARKQALRDFAAPDSLAKPADLSDLFFSADAAERRLILFNIEFAPLAPIQPISGTSASELASRLETAALTRNTGELMQIIENACAIDRAHAERVVNDRSGEPIIVVAKALAVPADVLQRMLLFLNANVGHSVARVYELAALFDEITPTAARCMIAIWRGSHRASARPARYAPVHWNDESPGSREITSPQPRRIGSALFADRRHLTRRRPHGD
ncbi:MAG: DUF2336 domain-containing protein [Rhizobiales bacterium]|nr:DUF2336 domain-containing protein [Hyphomicrobiales bacterium]